MGLDLSIGSTTRPYNKLSYTEAFERIAASGYDAVAVFANQGEFPVQAQSTSTDIAAVRQAAAQAGIDPSMVLGRTNLGLGLEAAVDEYKRFIDNVAAVGARWILELGTGNEEHFEIYFSLMQAVAPHAGAAGIGISMKPHGGISLTADDLLNAVDRVGHPAFKACFDPGNIIYYTLGSQRPETDVRRVAAKVSTAIIKDCVLKDGRADVMVTPGDGLVDFAEILSGLGQDGFVGPLYVECVGSDEVESIGRDLTFTRGYIKGILSTLKA
jgi:sugar phosphate isomerase/epimerase